MSDLRTVSTSYTQERAYDAGLRRYMLGVYNHMALAVAISGLTALGVYMLSVTSGQGSIMLKNGQALTSFGALLFASPLKWVLALAPLGFAFFFGFKAHTMRPSTAQVLFWLFAGLMGVSVGTLSMLVYTHGSVAQVFFITAAAFGGLSLWGYTTKKDISGWGSFLIMGVLGLIIAGLVNIFLQSSVMQTVISSIGVFVFAGLTAWDTQRIKAEYLEYGLSGEEAQRASVISAFGLYLNFVNLFQSLLSLLGNRE